MKPQIGRMASLEVHRDLSGGVRITFGDMETVVSPQDAVRLGSAILKAAGCNVNFENAPPPAILGLKR